MLPCYIRQTRQNSGEEKTQQSPRRWKQLFLHSYIYCRGKPLSLTYQLSSRGGHMLDRHPGRGQRIHFYSRMLRISNNCMSILEETRATVATFTDHRETFRCGVKCMKAVELKREHSLPTGSKTLFSKLILL